MKWIREYLSNLIESLHKVIEVISKESGKAGIKKISEAYSKFLMNRFKRY